MAANREIADQSRELVTIVREVPINLELERCAVHDYDRTAAVGIFQELEFRTLLGKLPGDQADVTAVGGEVAMQFSDCVSVVTTEELEQLADCISKAPMIAVDVETDGLDVQRCQLVGIAVATAEDAGDHIPLRHRDSELADPNEVDRIIRPVIEAHSNAIAHNAKFDLAVLQRNGYEGLAFAGDTMLAAYVLGENSLGPQRARLQPPRPSDDSDHSFDRHRTQTNYYGRGVC